MSYEILPTQRRSPISPIVSDPKSPGCAKIIKLHPGDHVIGEVWAVRLHRIRPWQVPERMWRRYPCYRGFQG